MAYRAFGVPLVFILGFAFLIVLIQMLAVTRLNNSPARLPWEEEAKEEWRDSPRLVHRESTPASTDRQASPPSVPLEHVSPLTPGRNSHELTLGRLLLFFLVSCLRGWRRRSCVGVTRQLVS